MGTFHTTFANSTMYIGEFARLAGSPPKAVRLYEQLGLLPKPRRRSKYRAYRAEDLEWVGFIRETRQLGCKLGELVPLLIKKPRIAGLFVIQGGRLS
ncbi:MerR family transcriptional regulator [Aeromonas sp. 1805]|uniref:MerR family transcriptional regulator n=1 Tax=Aeromonas sp. 1805 TaxID=2560028 RepID=UPI00209BDF6A|nr:MerR family transcriptional regulator [Aeromonas sp. 1805]